MACSFSISSYPLLSTNVLFCIDENVTPFICRRGPETDKFSDSFFKILDTLIGVFFFFSHIRLVFFKLFSADLCHGSVGALLGLPAVRTLGGARKVGGQGHIRESLSLHLFQVSFTTM